MSGKAARIDDGRRAAALEQYGLLDTPPEAVFDSLAQAAADVCEAPVALITLVDPERQWNKARVGISISELPRDVAFCHYTIRDPARLMEVEDARADLRFRDNPLVTGEAGIRFYAGQPLRTQDGFALGSLCVMDRRPRKLSASQRSALVNLSNAVVQLFEERRRWPLTAIGQAIEDNIYAGILLTDASKPDHPISYCNRGFELLTGYPRDEILGKNCRFLQGDDTDPEAISQMRDAIAQRRECTVTMKNYRKDGSAFWNELTIAPVWDAGGNVTHFLGIQSDVSGRRLAQERQAAIGSVLEVSSNEIFMFDESSLRFVHVNRGGQRNLGYSAAELLTMTPIDLKPDFTEETFRELLQPLKDDDEATINFTTVHQRKDGSRYPVEVHLQHARFDGRPVYVAVILDITKRTETERSLAEARLLLELAPDATIIVNAAGTIELANVRMVDLFGYEQDAFYGMAVEELMPARHRQVHVDHRRHYAEQPRFRGMGADNELCGLTKDGKEFPIEVSLSPITSESGSLVAASIRDVTARKQAESALRLSEERYRDLFDNANDLIQSVAADESIVFVNAAWRETLGYSEEEIKALRLSDIIDPDALAHCRSIFRRVLSGEIVDGVEAVFVTKSGEKIYVQGSVSCGMQDGTPAATRAIFHNVTQRRQAEMALQEAKNLAETATAAKSRFLAAASHDLRQPLQSLGLYLSVLNRLTTESSVLEISDKMRNSLDVMGELLDALLDISKLDSGAITPTISDFCVQSLFDKLTADSEPDAAKKGLVLRCVPSNCVLHSDAALLQRIVANFVGNAIRYTDSGSVEIRCTQLGEHARIEVKDTGAGIPKNALESIFEEYFQLDNPVRDRRKGLGLGLSIVKHIARLLGHQLHVSSVVGKGSVFAVEVPLGRQQIAGKKPIPPSRRADRNGQQTVVLFVDDDPAIVDATTLLLTVSGFEVHAAGDGDTALEYLNAGIRPDIVVSDYRLPGLNGVELIQRVRQATSDDLPCVLMTGDTTAGEIDVDSIRDCALLHKPVDTDRLVELIERAGPFSPLGGRT